MELFKNLKIIANAVIIALIFILGLWILIDVVCHYNRPKAVIELINETAYKHHLKPYDISIEIDENNNIYLRENLCQYTGECDGEVLENH